MPERKALLVVPPLAAVLVGLLFPPLSALPAAASAVAQKRVMASRTDGALRVVLTAERDDNRETATVVVAAYEKRGARWHLQGSTVLARRGAFSWSSVARPDAVRLFSVSDKDLSATFEVRISPAVGWSNTYLYRVDHGRLVGGAKACGCAPQN